MKKIYSLLILFSLFFRAQNYQVQTFNLTNSLIPFQNLNDLVIDHTDNVWFSGQISGGEWGGLGKKNGSQFSLYNTSNSGISENYIGQIRTDLANTIWTLHQHSVSKFDGTNWTVFNTSNHPFFSKNLYSFTITPNNEIWILGEEGTTNSFVLRYNGSTWTKYDSNDYPLISSISWYSNMVADEQNRVWISVQQQLIYFDGNNWGTKPMADGFKVIKAQQNKVYFVGSGGAYELNVINDVITNLNQNCNPQNCAASSLDIDNQGKVWLSQIAECGEGSVQNINDCIVLSNSQSADFPLSSIYNISVDSQNSVWAASTLGLVKISEQSTLSNQEISSQNFVKISPNPAEDFLCILTKSKINKVEVIDFSGRIVLKNSYLEDQKLDVSTLVKGNYLLKIKFENNLENTLPFIKK